MISKKSKGGKGKAETLRNEAIATLHNAKPTYFSTYKLGKIFERDKKTISGILSRYK